jgi:hypothetical protein
MQSSGTERLFDHPVLLIIREEGTLRDGRDNNQYGTK